MKTKKEILDYVVEQIKAQGGRATNGKTCRLEVEGKRCGFSLCLLDEERDRLIKTFTAGVVHCMTSEEVELILKPEFRGHEKNFWIDVQYLHDALDNWNDDFTLSEHGHAFYNFVLHRNGQVF